MDDVARNVPTYCRNLSRAEDDPAEFGPPEVPVLVRFESGIRVVLGTHDFDDVEKPDILIERRQSGWSIILHPSSRTDPIGYVYFLDNGRCVLVLETGSQFARLNSNDSVPEVDVVPD